MRHFIFSLFFFSTTLLLAQNKGILSAGLIHDNDVFFFSNKDENYTGGLNIEVQIAGWDLGFPFLNLPNGQKVNRIMLGGTAYTPQDLASTNVIYNDRPYSSLTFFGLGNSAYDAEKQKELHSTLYLGSLGSSKPGEVQYFLHDRGFLGSTRPNPKGWHNQIAYPGSFIVQYRLRYRKAIDNKTDWWSPYFTLGSDLGNYMTHLQSALGTQLKTKKFKRFGHQTPPPSLYGDDINSDSNQHGSRKIQARLFTHLRYRWVGYNATLEGALFGDKSVHTINRDKIQRHLLEWQGGIQLLLPPKILLGYTFSLRSQEFSGGERVHAWGAIGITFLCKNNWTSSSNAPTNF